MPVPNITQINQRLEDASKLVFKFPNPDGAPFTRTCPFFENPTIKEHQSSNLVKYDVIGRSGTLYGHTGAKSREFSINFFITLPHLKELSARLADSRKGPSELSKDEQKDAFFIDAHGPHYPRSDKGSYKAVFAEHIKRITYDDPNGPEAKFYNMIKSDREITEQFAEVTSAVFNEVSFATAGKVFNPDLDNPIFTPKSGAVKGFTDRPEVDLLVYWINLIRSSTLTYAPNPSVGPPIIRFSHGMLYRNIATVASKYSITADDKSGYDEVSLLPRRIEVNIQLHEVQSNGDRNFELGKQTSRDRISGWEEVIGRLDPEK